MIPASPPARVVVVIGVALACARRFHDDGWKVVGPDPAQHRIRPPRGALAAVPLGRAAEPEEMAELVHWPTTGADDQYVSGGAMAARSGLMTR
jgi:NAD(P)-dependent dehydrogenase (short-subunit alcohol dehydrogenase family)